MNAQELTRIERTFDAKYVNEIINHPSVFPHVAIPGVDYLDLTTMVANWRNVFLRAPGGVMAAVWQEPNVYEVHVNFLEDFRGLSAIRALQQACHFMFTQTDAMELLTKVPVSNPAALGACRATHWQFDFQRKDGWTTHDGKVVNCEYWSLRYPQWMKTAKGLEEKGKWFHDRLFEELAKIGVEHKEHPDPSHDRAVGATVEMILGGQIDKGLILYSRWARFVGYPVMQLVSMAPLVLDCGEALLFVQNGDFVALKKEV
jgi:hypothetical protein